MSTESVRFCAPSLLPKKLALNQRQKTRAARKILKRAASGPIHLRGPMWAPRDDGKNVSWKGALKYCRDLRLAGYSNWRLASRTELGAIYDRNANAPGSAGSGRDSSFTYHVKGDLFLTGDEWSSERINDDRGRPSAYSWYFDFNEGRSDEQPSGFPYPHSLMRALCVRGSQK
jgi:hypothetical protein